MNILFITAEVAPFSRSGGLGHVCASLPLALAELGHELMVVSPRYRHLGGPPVEQTPHEFWFWLDGQPHQARYAVHRTSERLLHVFVDNPMFDRDGYYRDARGDYGDNLTRFALLCRAALEAPNRLGVWDEPDVIHGHDWQAGLAPCYVNALYKPLGLRAATRTVFTVHNAAHQGAFPATLYPGLDLSPRHRGGVVWGESLITLKAGLQAADHVTAVSPTFAQELCTPLGGFGLDRLMRQKRRQGQLTGLLNGIDTARFDPATDPNLPTNFTRDALEGKARCKAALQRELGLPERADAPLFMLIARLAWQKGIDLVCDAMPDALSGGAQLVVMGDGDPELEAYVEELARAWPDQARAWIGFEHGLSMRMYAAADACLVPSRFEPCGLSQLYAMRYGALPVVRRTGGLRDTIAPWNPATREGTGFCFEEASVEGLGGALAEALMVWREDPTRWRQMRDNAMARDSSWGRAAETYVKVYGAA